MLTLDCESRESALASIAAIYGVSANEIESILLSLELDSLYSQNHSPQHPPKEELRLLVEKSVGHESSQVDRVCWFHLTRTHHRADFSNGIQPLSTALVRVWEIILEVFRGTKHEKPLTKLRYEGVPDGQYQMKTSDPLHAGPYAMLIREVAMHPRENNNHDYLWLPEIMEDICNGYCRAHGVSLHDALNGALTPKIVKFWSADQCRLDHIATALYYLYRTARDVKSASIPNTCFVGNNQTIPPEQILRVETINCHNSVPATAYSGHISDTTFLVDDSGAITIRIGIVGEGKAG